MKEYRVTRCWHWKGETASQSINNPRNQEDAGTFPTREKAEEWKSKLKEMEAARIERERKEEQGWNGNECVFWIDEITT